MVSENKCRGLLPTALDHDEGYKVLFVRSRGKIRERKDENAVANSKSERCKSVRLIRACGNMIGGW